MGDTAIHEQTAPSALRRAVLEQAVQSVLARFGAERIERSEFRDNLRLHVPRELAYEVLAHLKHACGFDMLIDITAVDYLNYPRARDRFAVIWSLLHTESGARLYVKTYLNEPELSVPTVFDLWKAADWLEREVYDMFGIRFVGHPNLRRILLPEEFTAYPLRKDYPLRGRGERHNFRKLTREQS